MTPNPQSPGADVAAGEAAQLAPRTLRQLADEYLVYKADRGKRSLAEDRRILSTRLPTALGAETPARSLLGPSVARRRGGEVEPYTVALELAVLRHMLARRGGKFARRSRPPSSEPRSRDSVSTTSHTPRSARW
jgi:hypothetical protein